MKSKKIIKSRKGDWMYVNGCDGPLMCFGFKSALNVLMIIQRGKNFLKWDTILNLNFHHACGLCSDLVKDETKFCVVSWGLN